MIFREICFVIIQNNTTIKPTRQPPMPEIGFVIIQNNTTIKQKEV